MKKSLFIISQLLSVLVVANNPEIRNTRLVSDKQIEFEVKWEHCWKMDTGPSNHDALWIFLKISSNNIGWTHLDLSSQISDYENQLSGYTEIMTVSDHKGFFLKAATTCAAMPWQKIRIGLKNPLSDSLFYFKIFAIEMVFIPEGSFFLGDSVSINSFCKGTSTASFCIGSENAICGGNCDTCLNSLGIYLPASLIPAAYPKGYKGFYIMKYEISQQQYVAFLNTLPVSIQVLHTAVSPYSAAGTFAMGNEALQGRNSIVITRSSTGNIPAAYGCNGNHNGQTDENDDGGLRAANLLNWNDILAYLDWASLRPLTETEFEKTCRGPQSPIAGEFCWGTPLITDANTIIFDGTPFETASDEIAPGSGFANTGYEGLTGPLRCGFSGRGTTNRLTAGATYYGVFEMSGNVWELVVTTSEAGVLFEGNNGDGLADNQIFGNDPSWPGNDGAGYRGGAWNSGIYNPGQWRDLAVSDRYYAGLKPDIRRTTSGGRGARTIIE